MNPPTPTSRRPYTKEAVWIERIREAENSALTNAKWCAAHDLVFSSFRAWKCRLRKRDLLSGLFDLADGFLPPEVVCPPFFTLPLAASNLQVHFATLPAGRAGFDFFYWQIRAAFPQGPTCGDCYLFLSRDHATVYSLRYRGEGFVLTRSFRNQGTFRWPTRVSPSGVSDLPRAVLSQLLAWAAVQPDGSAFM